MGWALRGNNRFYRWFLLLASLFFYGMGGGGYIGLLFLVALLNWGCVRLMDRAGRRKRLCCVSITVALHVLILAFFKYYEPMVIWAMGQFGASAEWMFNTTLAELVMPIGLSFYSFQGLSYTIDHYRDEGLAPRSYVDVLSYLAFFPTVMSGPIMREEQFFPQLRTSYAGEEDFSEGMTLILSGLFKKVALATYLQTHLVDAVFETPGDYSSAAALVAIYAYTIQIYCDFSGYTDLALGIGRLMGFHLPKNFDAPYRSLSLQEFWRRWHISLSTWLRDYLYIPLGGNRRGSQYVNIIITMVIGGMWHGSGLNFLIWGFFHGVGQAVAHAWRRVCKALHVEVSSAWLRLPLNVVSWLLTLNFVALLWVFFRADSYESAMGVLGQVAVGTAEGSTFPVLVLVGIGWGLALQFCGAWLRDGFTRMLGMLPWPVQSLAVGLAAALILNMGPDGALPFIYFNF